MQTSEKKELYLGLYRTMLRIRRFEEAVAVLYSQGELPGFVHLYIGEEAVATGVCASLLPTDCILSTHRGHGHCIAKGASMSRMMAELLGRGAGYCRGKGGSMHIADLSVGILGANGIVGGGIPIAAGAAAAMEYRKTGGVAVAFFGDGATATGAFHETCNLAATWKLPVLFVCENNLFAENMPLKQHLSVSTVAARAQGYEMRSQVVDGNDVLAVLDAAREAVKIAREGGGPTFIECRTYRWKGHSQGDPPPPDLEQWKQRCPIQRQKATILGSGIADEKELVEIEKSCELEVQAAVESARHAPAPALESALQDLYAL